MKKMLTVTLVGVICCCVLSSLGFLTREGYAQAVSTKPSVLSAEDADTTPYNLVVVVMDFTVSFRLPSKAPGFKGRVFALEALQLVQQFLRDAAKQPHRRNEGRDVYAIVALDAASQTIWTGTRDQLSELSADNLKEKLAARDAFKWCTDIEAAFNEVVGLFHKYSNASEKYLLVFSDLINEPPQRAWNKCGRSSGEPPKGIDWSALKTARLGFYFAAKDFPHRPDVKWRSELERRGLQAEFLDTAQALSAGPALSPPPPAIYKPTQEEMAVARAQVEGLSNTVVRAIAFLVGLVVVSITSLFGWVIWTRRRNVGVRRAS